MGAGGGLVTVGAGAPVGGAGVADGLTVGTNVGVAVGSGGGDGDRVGGIVGGGGGSIGAGGSVGAGCGVGLMVTTWTAGRVGILVDVALAGAAVSEGAATVGLAAG